MVFNAIKAWEEVEAKAISEGVIGKEGFALNSLAKSFFLLGYAKAEEEHINQNIKTEQVKKT